MTYSNLHVTADVLSIEYGIEFWYLGLVASFCV